MLRLLLCAALVAVIPVSAIAADPSSDARADASSAAAAAIVARVTKAADWQLANAEDASGFTYPHETSDKRGWVQAPFWIAVERLAKETGAPRFAAATDRIGAYNGWMPGDRVFHADDHAIIQMYVASHHRQPDIRKIAPSVTQLRAIMKVAPDGSMIFDPAKQQADGGFECQLRWCWSDALYMGPASWIGIGNAVGDPRFTAYADKEFWATHEALYSKEDGLFFRDSRFKTRTGEHGEKLYWSRGNGWVFAGLANILQILPADHPSRPRYVALFREMAASLLARQMADGFWPTSLAAPAGQGTAEASGTAFFVYGLAYGVNEGLLDARRFGPAAAKGWRGLDTALSAEGRLGLVQQIGDAPAKVDPKATQFYGTGGYIVAGLEVARGVRSGRIAL